VSEVTSVTIVRHGEAVINTERGLAAEDCRGLTHRGRAQAEYIAIHLAASTRADAGFDVLYASPRRRCMESVEPVAKALNLDVVFAPELRSLDHGPGDPWDPESNAIGTIPPLAPEAARCQAPSAGQATGSAPATSSLPCPPVTPDKTF